MNIWMLNATFFPARGGIENYLHSAGKVLKELGHRPLVICRRHHPSLPEREERDGIKIIRHPDFPVPRSQLWRKPAYLTERIAGWIRASGLAGDGLALSRHLYYQAAISSLSRNPAQVYMPPSCWPRLMSVMRSSWTLKERIWARLWKGQIGRIGKQALFGAGRTVVFSENLKEQLETLHGRPPEIIEINPPGVDLQRFAPGPGNLELARRLRVHPGTVTLLYIGRLSPEKNLTFLIRAVAPLLTAGKAKLVIAGDGSERSRLEGEIRKGGLQNTVILTGGNDQPEELYRLCDIFVSSSRYESFGQTILEAMASALPVVALKRKPPDILTASEEIIRDGETGFCVPAAYQSFREKLTLLINSPRLRRDLGNKGRDVCQTEYTWQRHIDRLLNRPETQ